MVESGVFGAPATKRQLAREGTPTTRNSAAADQISTGGVETFHGRLAFDMSGRRQAKLAVDVASREGLGDSAAIARGIFTQRGKLSVLRDSPKNPRGIPEREVAHAPGLLDYFRHLHAIPLRKPRVRDFRVPRSYVFNEEMKHEVFGKLLVVEVLEQEARLVELETGNTAYFRPLGKAELGIEAPRQSEVTRRNEGLELNYTQGQGAAPGHTGPVARRARRATCRQTDVLDFTGRALWRNSSQLGTGMSKDTNGPTRWCVTLRTHMMRA